MAVTEPARPRLRMATVSLAGCFGCHMSLLDIDERFFELVKHVDFDRSPLTDIKHCGPCDIGLIEGGLCNSENVQVLREFRAQCKVLVAVGACAINGGLPAQRNALVPNDPELPLPLAHVHPIHEVVHVDHFLPGCPPSADAIWALLSALVEGRMPPSQPSLIHFD